MLLEDSRTAANLLSSSRFSLVRCAEPSTTGFEEAVRSGLTDRPKHLPCRFLYDDEGSRLFEAICREPEYYLTRSEEEIIHNRVRDIAVQFGQAVRVVDLGSGSSSKTGIIINEFISQGKFVQYVPIDISPLALEIASEQLLGTYPALEIAAIAGEYTSALEILAQTNSEPQLVLWLGSNIGNLNRKESVDFLRQIRRILGPKDRLLVGIDLHKDRITLERAYNDSAGVTARFSKNILARINRELGGEFNLSHFTHRALYDEGKKRIEISLVSNRAQRVRVSALDLEIDFPFGEPIHTEYSHKYSVTEIQDLVRAAGLIIENQWLDRRGFFSLNMLNTAA